MGLPTLKPAIAAMVQGELQISALLAAINEHEQLDQSAAAVDSWAAAFRDNLYDSLSSICHRDAVELKAIAPCVPSRVLDYVAAASATLLQGRPSRRWARGTIGVAPGGDVASSSNAARRSGLQASTKRAAAPRKAPAIAARAARSPAPAAGAPAGSSDAAAAIGLASALRPSEDGPQGPAIGPAPARRRPAQGESLNLWLVAQLRSAGQCLTRRKDSRQFAYIKAAKVLQASAQAPIRTLSDLDSFLDRALCEPGGKQTLTRGIREELRMLVGGSIEDLAEAKEREAQERQGEEGAGGRRAPGPRGPGAALPASGRGRQHCSRAELIRACELRRDYARAKADAQSFRRWLEALRVLGRCRENCTVGDLQRHAGRKDTAEDTPRLVNTVFATLRKIIERQEAAEPEAMWALAASAGEEPDIPPCRLDFQSPRAALLLALARIEEVGTPEICKEDIIREARGLCKVSFEPEPGSFFTAWSEIKRLERCELVARRKRPPPQTHVFSLTPSGRAWADHVKQDYGRRDARPSDAAAASAAADGPGLRPAFNRGASTLSVGQASSASAASSHLGCGPGRTLERQRRKMRAREMLRKDPLCVSEVERHELGDGVVRLTAEVNSDTRKTRCFGVEVKLKGTSVADATCGCEDAAKQPGVHCKHVWATRLAACDPEVQRRRQEASLREACLSAPSGRGGRGRGRARGRGQRAAGRAAPAAAAAGPSAAPGRRRPIATPMRRSSGMEAEDPRVRKRRGVDDLAPWNESFEHELLAAALLSGELPPARSLAEATAPVEKRRRVLSPTGTRMPWSTGLDALLSSSGHPFAAEEGGTSHIDGEGGACFPGQGRTLGSEAGGRGPGSLSKARERFLAGLPSASSPAAASSSEPSRPPREGAAGGLQLVVDTRERTRNSVYMALFADIEEAVRDLKARGLDCRVCQEELLLGDYLWKSPAAAGYLQGMAVERKTIRDLVARSGHGAHLRQSARLQGAGFHRVVFVLEGPERATANALHHLDTPTIRDVDSLWRFMIEQQLDGVSFVQTRDNKDTARWLAAASVALAEGVRCGGAPPTILPARSLRGPAWPTEDVLSARAACAVAAAGGEPGVSAALLVMRFGLELAAALQAVATLLGDGGSSGLAGVTTSVVYEEPPLGGQASICVTASRHGRSGSFCVQAVQIDGGLLVQSASDSFEGGEGCAELWQQARIVAESLALQDLRGEGLDLQVPLLVGVAAAERKAFEERRDLGHPFSDLLRLTELALLHQFPATKSCTATKDAEGYTDALRTLLEERSKCILAHSQGDFCEVINDSLE